MFRGSVKRRPIFASENDALQGPRSAVYTLLRCTEIVETILASDRNRSDLRKGSKNCKSWVEKKLKRWRGLDTTAKAPPPSSLAVNGRLILTRSMAGQVPEGIKIWRLATLDLRWVYWTQRELFIKSKCVARGKLARAWSSLPAGIHCRNGRRVSVLPDWRSRRLVMDDERLLRRFRDVWRTSQCKQPVHSGTAREQANARSP